MTNALNELRAGQFGPDFADALYLSMRVAARAHNFPPPAGHDRWTPEAVKEASHSFLVSANIKRRLTEAAIRAADDAELRKVLQTACANYLREQSRKTALGRLVLRLKDVLGADPEFTQVQPGVPGAGNIALSDGPTDPFGGGDDVLVRAAWTVQDVAIVKWRSTTRREPPIADRDSIVRVSRAVLKTANGSLRWPDLARAVGARFGLSEVVPAVQAVEDVDDLGSDVGAPAMAPMTAVPGAELELRAAAEDVLAQLTLSEVLALPVLDQTVRDIAQRVGCAPSTAAVLKSRVSDKLRIMLAGEPDGENILLAAVDIARDRHQ